MRVSKGKDTSVPAWGKIPHMSVTIGKLTFDAPVAVTRHLEPVTDASGYVYALPAGGRINSNGVIL